MHLFVKPFSEITAGDVALAGGKGANLGEMYQQSIPVPNGFVVLSACFREFIGLTRLEEELATALKSVNGDDIDAMQSLSDTLTHRILEAPVPGDMSDQTLRYFDQLGAPLVAVRSSATAEDGADSAWAGQLDTYLGTTRDDLLNNIKRSWASLYTPRALSYRFQKKLMGSDIAVAVVIQEMVASEVSGVSFSVHPVTQDPNQLIIEAGFGLGEAVVSGLITPDSYVVRKSDLTILEDNPSSQEKGIFLNSQGGSDWKELSPDQQTQKKLKPDEIVGLARQVIRIESLFGYPCDIEWARKGDQWYILQCRPITTLGQ